MTAPQEVVELIERFDRNVETYKSIPYNETQLRREFLDPFFEALGWDVSNTQGYAEAYKDVIHEDAIKVGGYTKAPDYGFRIGGMRKFFLEAKKPSVDIKGDTHPAYQLRRYAWSAKLPLSILSDFEEFAVYDCRIKPVQTDRAATARTLYCKYTEYADRWDEIASIFSREAILRGSFDQYVESSKIKKGTAEVDSEFLKEIESWRNMLARNLALRNPELTQRELNFAVGRTIDRIIFLRICEDRGVEDYGQLMALQNGKRIYARLCQLFRSADDRYNSGLFHFKAEEDRPEPPDDFTLNLIIDDQPLRDIFKSLYYPDSPYEFSVLSADILGQVYEQFLGKVIRLTPSHRAVVEDKPEVKKAGGVYYTPTYIVSYIVENTVGKLLKDKTPKQAEKLKILDPACGSGSFLIGAYQYLLDWHHKFYVDNDPEKWVNRRSPTLYQGAGGDYHLTTAERKRILLNNIYGVDIDSQAVEVTKLSLLLKVLEGENEQTLTKQIEMFHERALPDLGDNIKCGNSLIDSNFYKSQQMSLLGEEEHYRINVFDWETEFSEVMQVGGFDAVIGNPPYIRIQALKEWVPLEVEFYKQRYATANKGNYDIYVVFVERGLNLLNDRGQMGFILPNKFFSTDYGEALRQSITDRKALVKVVDFGHAQVFENATIYTCLLFLMGKPSKSILHAKVPFPSELVTNSFPMQKIESDTLTSKPWLFATDAEKRIVKKITEKSLQLGNLPSRIGRGSSSGSDNIFLLRREGESIITRQGDYIDIETDILKIPIHAKDFGRYSFGSKSEGVIIFPYDVTTNGYKLKSEHKMKRDFPKAYRYLVSKKKKLETRRQFKEWYGFSAPRNLNVHNAAHILVPLLANRGLYCYLPEKKKEFCLMASAGFSITIDTKMGLSPKYVLGLLNSRLLFWRLNSISNIFRDGWITCTKQYVETLPIRTINFSDSADKARHDQMVMLVDQMLSLHKQLAKAKVNHAKTTIQRQIEATDQQIDRLVYELYGLTKEEIEIVKEGIK